MLIGVPQKSEDFAKMSIRSIGVILGRRDRPKNLMNRLTDRTSQTS